MRLDDEWLITRSGRIYYPCDPRHEDVDIGDIAHALSNLCRYAGHTSRFYSVAEHSVLVSHMVPPELALEGLLHDASEAYCSDVVRPLKGRLDDYRKYEALNHLAVRTHFHLPHVEHPLVKKADNDILLSEIEVLLPPMPTHLAWGIGWEKDHSVAITGWSPIMARELFLARYDQLTRIGT